ncbi:hypothetical protein L9F63_021118, partial [Diploptera punctata]
GFTGDKGFWKFLNNAIKTTYVKKELSDLSGKFKILAFDEDLFISQRDPKDDKE